MRYDVDADIYEGPLPLLVELAKLNLIDIFMIQLMDLTQQYLQEVKAAGGDVNELAEPRPRPGTPAASLGEAKRAGVAEGSADNREVVGLPHHPAGVASRGEAKPGAPPPEAGGAGCRPAQRTCRVPRACPRGST